MLKMIKNLHLISKISKCCETIVKIGSNLVENDQKSSFDIKKGSIYVENDQKSSFNWKSSLKIPKNLHRTSKIPKKWKSFNLFHRIFEKSFIISNNLWKNLRNQKNIKEICIKIFIKPRKMGKNHKTSQNLQKNPSKSQRILLKMIKNLHLTSKISKCREIMVKIGSILVENDQKSLKNLKEICEIISIKPQKMGKYYKTWKNPSKTQRIFERIGKISKNIKEYQRISKNIKEICETIFIKPQKMGKYHKKWNNCTTNNKINDIKTAINHKKWNRALSWWIDWISVNAGIPKRTKAHRCWKYEKIWTKRRENGRR